MDDTLKLSYDLFTLPTAQHRAGLAGLFVVADTMRRRGLPNVPDTQIDGSGVAQLTLTRASLTAIFNELYEATTEEMRQNKVRKDRRGETIEPLRIERETHTDRRTGKESTKTTYVYPQVVPKAPFLQSLAIPDPWLKLWRDVVWYTLRGVPRTRRPYECRAASADVEEAARVWGDLAKWKRATRSGRTYTAEVSSSLFVGAQAVNAERVPFVGSPDQTLLLHFWPAVMGIGEARKLKLANKKVEEETTGYVITVPDVADLDGFIHDFRDTVAQLDPAVSGYRPREAILSIPEEGGLAYLNHLVALERAKAQAGAIWFSVAGVEVYHLAKQGNSISVLATGRVPARRELVEQYEVIRGRYRNLLFRGQLIRNLLHGQPWYDGFDRAFATRNLEMFIGPNGAYFPIDVSRKFQMEFALSRAGGTDDE